MNNKEKILAPLTICHLVLTALAIVLSVIGLVTLLNITEGPYVYPGKLRRYDICAAQSREECGGVQRHERIAEC